MKSPGLAISTAIIAMKLKLVTDAETFRKKKVDILFCRAWTMLYMHTPALATQKRTDKKGSAQNSANHV
jgi:hypothetical protein